MAAPSQCDNILTQQSQCYWPLNAAVEGRKATTWWNNRIIPQVLNAIQGEWQMSEGSAAYQLAAIEPNPGLSGALLHLSHQSRDNLSILCINQFAY